MPVQYYYPYACRTNDAATPANFVVVNSTPNCSEMRTATRGDPVSPCRQFSVQVDSMPSVTATRANGDTPVSVATCAHILSFRHVEHVEQVVV